MKKLSKDQVKRKAEIVQRLAIQEDVIETALEAYNEAVVDAQSFVEEVIQEQEDYKAERSEKWSDSDAGEQYACWSDAWSTESFESVELELDHAERLEALPDEVEEA